MALQRWKYMGHMREWKRKTRLRSSRKFQKLRRYFYLEGRISSGIGRPRGTGWGFRELLTRGLADSLGAKVWRELKIHLPIKFLIFSRPPTQKDKEKIQCKFPNARWMMNKVEEADEMRVNTPVSKNWKKFREWNLFSTISYDVQPAFVLRQIYINWS